MSRLHYCGRQLTTERGHFCPRLASSPGWICPTHPGWIVSCNSEIENNQHFTFMLAKTDYVDIVWTYMKTATLRQLRNETGILVKWVEAGETVLVTKRSKPIFKLLPVPPVGSESFKIPDFEERQKSIFPDGLLTHSMAKLIAEERGRY
jgi:prevent-host-death family protein